MITKDRSVVIPRREGEVSEWGEVCEGVQVLAGFAACKWGQVTRQNTDHCSGVGFRDKHSISDTWAGPWDAYTYQQR